MPDERPQIPPPRFAVREFTTPNFADGFYSEVFKRTDPAYMAMQVPKRGTLYSSIQNSSQNITAQFPNLYFLKELRLGTSHEFVIWLWGTDPQAEDTYNSLDEFVSESLACPQFTRVYNIRRDVYQATPTPLVMGSALPGLVAIKVNNGGNNYSAATTIAFSTGTGKAYPIISGGVIISVIIENEGAYTSVPTVTAVDSGGGSGAVLTGFIQSSNAVLVSQKKQEFPDDHPLRNEYVRVSRIYMTLPGPVLTGARFDPTTGQVMTTTEQIVAAGTPGVSLQADGSFAEVTPITSVISKKTTAFAVGSALIDGQAWQELKYVSLPRVLTSLTTISFNDTDGNTIFAGLWYYLQDYSGYWPVLVHEQWSNAPLSPSSENTFIQQAISFITPLGSGSVPECLHDTIEITGNTASDGSTPAGGGRFYAYITWDFVFPATSPTNLGHPTTIILEEIQRRFAGGFLQHREYISI